MSLDKAIEHNKEYRKPYTGAKAIDRTCRNHGSCDWCYGNRVYQKNRKEEACRQKIKNYEEGDTQ